MWLFYNQNVILLLNLWVQAEFHLNGEVLVMKYVFQPRSKNEREAQECYRLRLSSHGIDPDGIHGFPAGLLDWGIHIPASFTQSQASGWDIWHQGREM